MIVTREYFAPINIKIQSSSEFDVLVNTLEAAVEDYEIGSLERDTLIAMCNTFSEIPL
jgi:hypothetical protein